MDVPSILATGEAATQAGTPLTLVGVLAIGLSALASVVVFLFLRYDRRNDQIAKEREEIAKEREGWRDEKIRLETATRERQHEVEAGFELRARELAEKYARELAEQVRLSREHEEEFRSGFAGTIETMAEQQAKTTDAQVKMLEKLADRLVANRDDRGRYGR